MNETPPLPSALADFTRIERRLAGQEVGVFLDYDGTLTPIADRPDLAVLSDEMRRRLVRLGGLCPTAIVSGRALEELKDLVRVDNLFYAGSHGFEIVGPPGSGIRHAVAKGFLPAIESACAELHAQLDPIEGVLVETKGYSLSVHYRLVADRSVPAIDRALDQVLQGHPTLRRTHGKKVFEIRPRVDWHKGKAVEWIAAALGLNSQVARLFYIGDDATDEDAFRAIADTGFGILVSDEPRPTAALYGLRDPREVGLFLERVVHLRSPRS